MHTHYLQNFCTVAKFKTLFCSWTLQEKTQWQVVDSFPSRNAPPGNHCIQTFHANEQEVVTWCTCTALQMANCTLTTLSVGAINFSTSGKTPIRNSPMWTEPNASWQQTWMPCTNTNCTIFHNTIINAQHSFLQMYKFNEPIDIIPFIDQRK